MKKTKTQINTMWTKHAQTAAPLSCNVTGRVFSVVSTIDTNTIAPRGRAVYRV